MSRASLDRYFMASAREAVRPTELLLDQAPGCNWLLTSDLVFHSVHGDAQPLFGRPASDLRHASLAEVLPPEALAAWSEQIRRVFGGEALRFDEQRAQAGFSVHLFPVRHAGKTVFAGGLGVDAACWSGEGTDLRRAVLSVQRAQEAERARLAKFLHDEVGQCLSAAGLQLDLLRMDLELSVPGISARTAEVQQVLERVMERVREYSYELNVSLVERAGLRSALDRLAGRLRGQFSGNLRMMVDSSVRLPGPVATALYKIAEQAVDNAVRHSGCGRIEVRLKSTQQGPVLEIRDDGCGFDPSRAARSRGLGLLTMEYCASEAHIALSIAQNRPKGTVVRASCSYKGNQE
jgi:signal transduction histidine kinase